MIKMGTPKTMTFDFNAFMKQAEEVNKILENNYSDYHSRVEITRQQFAALLKVYAERYFRERGVVRTFIIDDDNKGVIRNLYFYLLGDSEQCTWNINAGILLQGKVGCGKSVLMKAFFKIADSFTSRNTTQVHSKELLKFLTSRTIEDVKYTPLFIDELGRENAEQKDYGNVIKPVIDLFSLRYELGARTYATSNFNLDTLEKMYGNFIRTRMEEMFNIVVLPGENRRIKNEF